MLSITVNLILSAIVSINDATSLPTEPPPTKTTFLASFSGWPKIETVLLDSSDGQTRYAISPITSLSLDLGIIISSPLCKPTITVFKSGNKFVKSEISVSTIGQSLSILIPRNFKAPSTKGMFSIAPGISSLLNTFFATSFSGEIITLTGNLSLVNKSW